MYLLLVYQYAIFNCMTKSEVFVSYERNKQQQSVSYAY